MNRFVGCWGVLTSQGPLYNELLLPALFSTKAEASAACTLTDMKPVRVTVRYPTVRPRR